MRSMRNAHIVVVGSGDLGLALTARLRRMALAKVTAVADLAEASGLCQRGEADACIVMRDDGALDRAASPMADAPGRASGVPSLMVVPAVTPFARKVAHREGYMAALPANIAPRMLYRRIGAALQRRGGGRRPQPAGIDAKYLPVGAGLPALVTGLLVHEGKLTLH